MLGGAWKGGEEKHSSNLETTWVGSGLRRLIRTGMICEKSTKMAKKWAHVCSPFGGIGWF